jgi:HEAT repeat protein
MTTRNFFLSTIVLALMLPVAYAQNLTTDEVYQSTDEDFLIKIIQRQERDVPTIYLFNLASKRLGTYGTAKSIPELVKLLGDDKVAHYARYALETIPAPEVNAALREAVKTQKGKLLAGVINSLGVRRDAGAMSVIAPLLKSDDADVVNSAYGYFGYIGTPESADFLLKQPLNEKYKKYHADALFEVAQQLRANGNNRKAIEVYTAIGGIDFAKYQKNGALYWRIKTTANEDIDSAITLLLAQTKADESQFAVALKAARELPAGDAVAKAMVGELDKLQPERKALWIAALGDRIDDASKKVSLPVIGKQLSSKDAAVKLAAVKALARIADGSVLTALIDAATDEDETIAEAARLTIIGISGTAVDNAIVNLLKTGNVKQKKEAIYIVEQRRISSAFGLLKDGLKDPETRDVALKALGQVATIDDLPVLLNVLDSATSQQEVDAINAVLMSAVTRMKKEDATKVIESRLKGASVGQQVSIISLLKELGGKQAVEIVNGYAWGASAETKDAAIAALGSWRSPEDIDLIADVCLKIAKEAKENKYKSRALKGYLRLARQFSSIPEERKLQMVKQYMELATSKADRLLAFDVFTRTPSPKTIDAAVAYISDADLKDKAIETAVVIGEKMTGKSAAAAASLQKAADATTNADLKRRAQVVVDKLK